MALPDLSRLYVPLLLLGAAAFSGCASTEEDAAMTLAMAPTSSVSLPDTMMVPSVVSAGYAEDASLASSDGEDPALVSPDGAGDVPADATVSAMPAEPVTTAKQGRLVARSTPPVSELAVFPAAPPEPEEKVAALAVAEAPRKSLAQSALSLVSLVKPDSPETDIDRLIEKYAELYDVPESLVRRVVKRESNFRPGAVNRGHYGLMQIKPATARSMGYRGSARGLLDAETNLKYAVKYLRGAYLVADGNHDRADRFYQRGYYYDAKRRGLLDETGLGKDRRRRKA